MRTVLKPRRLEIALLALCACAGAPRTPPADSNAVREETQELTYARFFDKLRQRVAAEWDIEIIVALQREPRLRETREDRSCRVRYTIEANGAISAVSIELSSGIRAMDEASALAFLRVGKVDPPPPALLNANGQLRANVHVPSACGERKHPEPIALARFKRQASSPRSWPKPDLQSCRVA